MSLFRKKPKRAKLIKRVHLIGRTEYICSACGAACAKGAGSCVKCGARFRSVKYDPEWMDELADSE